MNGKRVSTHNLNRIFYKIKAYVFWTVNAVRYRCAAAYLASENMRGCWIKR